MLIHDVPVGFRQPQAASSGSANAVFSDEGREASADQRYVVHISVYTECGVSQEQLRFGAARNMIEDAFAASNGKKQAATKGKREVYLKDLVPDDEKLFTGEQGSDNKEWNAWLEMEAAEVVDAKESEMIRKDRKNMIIATRWVRTDKSDDKNGHGGQEPISGAGLQGSRAWSISTRCTNSFAVSGVDRLALGGLHVMDTSLWRCQERLLRRTIS